LAPGICVAQALGAGWTVADTGAGQAQPSKWAVIRRLAVDPQLRGRGIGSNLLAEQLRRLSRNGCGAFVLHAPDGPDEAAARGVYAKFAAVVDRQYVLRLSF
jgi:GNAT superfamily N-acetyltransferase